MSEQINKEDMIRLIARKTGYRKTAVTQVYEALVDNIVEALADDKKVNVTGLGVFEPRVRAARTGRNVKKGVPVHIPERVLPYFTPCASFKQAVSKEGDGK